MCGVAGALSPHPLTPGQKETVRAINQRMFHRGPDAQGEFFGDESALCMRRLKIVDLTTGDQPVFNETRDIVVVANGEIYNHNELRSRLMAKGHVFTTKSDIETIVHLYEEKGEAFLEDLRGMFALAIWDKRRKKLILARDRFGEKPLHLYHDDHGVLWFASELTALQPAIKTPRLSQRAAYLFLVYQYIPEPMTILENVTLLPAGSLLTITPEQIHTSSRRYWDFTERPPQDATHAAGRVEEVFSQSCRLMGTADVPVAISLSGGVDSSLVAIMASAHYPGQIGAFTVGYPGAVPTDERAIARKLARSHNLPFTEVIIDGPGMVAEFPDIVHAMAGAPVADIAAPGYYAVARAARNAGYPVLMSGIGGDELFWGYDWVRGLARDIDQRETGPTEGAGVLRRAMAWLGGKTFDGQKDNLFADIPLFGRNDLIVRALGPSNGNGAAWADGWEGPSRLQKAPVMDLEICRALNQTWLSANCLALSDRMSMAHSVELRLPFLDVELANTVAGFRRNGLKDWKEGGKSLLLKSMGAKLPPEVAKRPKQGFTPPSHWYEDVVAEYGAMLNGGYLTQSGFLDQAKTSAFMEKGDIFMRYKLILLEIMLRPLIEGERSAVVGQALGGGGKTR
jgi:asparagine synthase (glutamine-hydrolysing)